MILESISLGFLAEVEYSHEHGYKHWGLMLSGLQGCSDPSAIEGVTVPLWDNPTEREPTPIEIKLSAWLTVASDADGLMWYWGISSPGDPPDCDEEGHGNYLPGLLEWDGSPDFCSDGGARIVRTERYYAAKEVCNEIHEIAPTIESLEFGGTTASQVFTENYDNSAFPDSLRLYLDNWITYNGLSYQSVVKDIRTDAWDTVAGDWTDDAGDYAQLSYWKGLGEDPDFWFLVVNRRALAHEKAKVRVEIGALEPGLDYVVHYQLADSFAEAVQFQEGNHLPFDGAYRQKFEVVLLPGEAELVHFFVMDTSDLVIEDTTLTLKAPYYYNRNILLDNATVIIEPDTALQRYQIIKNGQSVDQWKDSLEILFAPGKGIKLIEPDSGSNKLTILGNDSTKIVLKCSKGSGNYWNGISFEGNQGDSLLLRNTVIASASIGANAYQGPGYASFEDCEFRACAFGVVGIGQREFRIDGTSFRENKTSAAFFTEGVQAQIIDCDFVDNEKHSLRMSRNCTGSVVQSSFVNNGVGLRANDCDLRLRCVTSTGNQSDGVSLTNGSIVMADTSNGSVRYWGTNDIYNNRFGEVSLIDPRAFVVANGENRFADSSSSNAGKNKLVKVLFTREEAAYLRFTGNNWGDLVDSADIALCIVPESISTTPIDTVFEACEWGQAPGEDDDELDCFVGGNVLEETNNLTQAQVSYKDLIESASSGCKIGTSVSRLLAVSFLDGVPIDTTLAYLSDVKQSATDQELVSDLLIGISHGLAMKGDLDSARTILEDVVSYSGDTLSRKIPGQVGLLSLDILEETADTVDGLTADELATFIDSLEQVIGQYEVWSQYEITDSVVMYAPMRVDSVINVRGDGVLTILPHPSYKNPTIEFVDQGAIKVWGTDTTKAKGKLYVYGEPDSRITLHWADSTGTKNVFSERGFVKLRDADFVGNGFVNQTQDLTGYFSGLRRATFQADSCTFSWFDEGVMVRATDTTSYMRACTFSYLGGNAFWYSGFGAGLVMLKSDGFVIEDCVFDSNDGVGIYHGFAEDVVIRNCQIRNGAKAGIYGASSTGGSARLECCTIESNGDTLPELWTLGVVYDLVGSHCSFSDSMGPLIKSDDPSYVDLENGENYFEVWNEGYYVQSGDTNETWDVTWNTWSPSVPGDGDFYDYLWPHTSSKWTLDSSLASFVSCGEYGTSSIGGESWLIVDPFAEESGTMSMDDEESQSASLALPSQISTKQATKERTTKSASKSVTKAPTEKLMANRKLANAERIAMHHKELSEWRDLRNANRSDVRQSAIKFIEENRYSEFVPAALRVVAGAARERGIAKYSSKYLSDFAATTKNIKQRVLAERLSYEALALEGKPGAALAGLESMMENATTPRDSALALLSAMQIYCDNHGSGDLQVKYNQIAVTDPYDLVRRTLQLSERLDDPTLGEQVTDTAIPTSYALYQNYPNPFNPTTEIRFDLPEAIHAELKVFNILGQEVATLMDDMRPAGAYRLLWDGKNAAGMTVASGVYIYQLKTPNFTNAKKMMLLR
ncbi:MAG: right-handed parallel beta-helix repeat-containing protein [Calditrichaeota bacterium]|nr:right-handed parallel beta-helix repeat-containing protein [Calditrichota bacterium]